MSTDSYADYDAVPYGTQAFPQSHPDRLATVAHLFGMQPAPVNACRVLELGCASGGNLIPMAQNLPGSTFLGIDLSCRQIEEGQLTIQTLGLQNVTLRHLNILDVDDRFGTFDYIICHGVYSWVLPDVQEKILSICEQLLAPAGVAYVSYNTLPGWCLRGLIRDMMLYHARRFQEPQARLREARAMLQYIADSTSDKQSPYALYLQQELQLYLKMPEWYLYHDHLEAVNAPCYFHQFVERAQVHRLQYLGEAELHNMAASRMTPELDRKLAEVGLSLLDLEQHQDFQENRAFRQTVLCRAGVPLRRHLSSATLEGLLVASALQPEGPVDDVSRPETVTFKGPGDGSASVSDPLIKAGLLELKEHWPLAIGFEQLLAAARSRLGRREPADAKVAQGERERLGSFLLRCATFAHLVELHVHAPAFVLEVSECPRASPLARFQAEFGNTATNVRHQAMGLNEVSRCLLRNLDGSHGRTELLAVMDNLVSRGLLKLEENGQPLPNGKKRQIVLHKALDHILSHLARDAFLVG